jgi:hypothetical protein
MFHKTDPPKMMCTFISWKSTLYNLLLNVCQYTVTCRRISMQRPKYAHATIEKVLEEVFSVWSAPCPVLGNGPMNRHSDTWHVFSVRFDPNLYNERRSRVEAGSNTSTVTLRVVGGDKRGSLKSETVKYGRKPQGTRTRERLRWQGQQHIQKTDPSSRQRG